MQPSTGTTEGPMVSQRGSYAKKKHRGSKLHVLTPKIRKTSAIRSNSVASCPSFELLTYFGGISFSPHIRRLRGG